MAQIIIAINRGTKKGKDRAKTSRITGRSHHFCKVPSPSRYCTYFQESYSVQ